MGAIKFFIEGIKHFKEVGTISRSSKFVGRTMCKHVDFGKAKCIVELGAGDGSITKEILKAMGPDSKLLSFEINEKLCEEMRKQVGEDPRLQIIQGDALEMRKHIEAAGFQEADYVVSAIPFVIIPEDDIIQMSHDCMAEGGKYIQLHYSTKAKKRYQRIFGNVEIDLQMLNIPPAFIHICEKRSS